MTFDEALHVSGIRILLTEKELSSTAVLQLTQSMESTQSSSTKLQGSETPSVNHTSMLSHRGHGRGRSFSQPSSGVSQNKGKPCYRCGGKYSVNLSRLYIISATKGAYSKSLLGWSTGTNGRQSSGKTAK